LIVECLDEKKIELIVFTMALVCRIVWLYTG